MERGPADPSRPQLPPPPQLNYESAAPLAAALGVGGPSSLGACGSWQSPVTAPGTRKVDELDVVDASAAKRAKTRPSCPQCSGNNVKTLGGGTKGKYRYTCHTCKTNWQQVPPHRLAESGQTGDADVNSHLQIRKRTITAPYKCHRCGQPKKGHICPGVGDTDVHGNPPDSEARPPGLQPRAARRPAPRLTTTTPLAQVLSVSANLSGPPAPSLPNPARPPPQLAPLPPLPRMPPWREGDIN